MIDNYINEIPELSRKNVYIKDPEKVNCLIDCLARGGAQKLQAVFDFDRTLTKQHEPHRKYVSSFEVFALCKSVTNEYLTTVRKLKEKYFPIEINPSVDHEEKRMCMEEWWQLSEKALKGLKVTRQELEENVRDLGPSLRDGTNELFKDLNAHNVPILVFSAGLGDVVELSLKHFDVFYPDVKVVSNFLKYSVDDEIHGFQHGIIHVLNKNEFALTGTPYYELVKSRDNVILAGDSLGDANMVDGMSHCNAVLKVGFLYDHVEENLPKYMDAFDIVLEDDQTMDIIRAILKRVL